MTPCSPATTFCSIVGQASFHTAGLIGPSMRERSNGEDFLAGAGADISETVILTVELENQPCHGGEHGSSPEDRHRPEDGRGRRQYRNDDEERDWSQRPHQCRAETCGPSIAHHQQSDRDTNDIDNEEWHRSHQPLPAHLPTCLPAHLPTCLPACPITHPTPAL